MDAAIYSSGDAYGLSDAGFAFGDFSGPAARWSQDLNLGSVRPRIASAPALGMIVRRPVLIQRQGPYQASAFAMRPNPFRYGYGNAGSYYTDDAGWSLGGLVSSIGSAVSSVVKSVPLVGTAVNTLSALGSGIVHGDFSKVKEALTRDPIGRFIGGAVSGENLGKAAMAAVNAGVKDAGEALRLAAMVAPMVPGIGSGVAAAIGAANALASGQRIDAALLSGVRSAIPGGPLAQAAFDVATKAVQGGSIADAALGAVRAQLPGGAAAQAAFDAAIALSKGKSLQDAAINAGAALLPASPYTATALDFARKVASGQPIAQAALSTAGQAIVSKIPSIIGTGAADTLAKVAKIAGAPMGASFDPGDPRALLARGAIDPAKLARSGLAIITGQNQPGARFDPIAMLGPAVTAAARFGGGGEGPSLLPPNVQQVASALVNRPELRSLPIESVARDLGVPLGDARQAAASIAQSAARVGLSGSPVLAPAYALEGRISGSQSVDQVLADLASNAAPIAQSPSPSAGAREVFIPKPSALASVLDHVPALRGHPIVSAWQRLAGAAQLDARGLDRTGAAPGAMHTASPPGLQWFWIVDAGTWPAKVAELVTGNASRWPEFIAANPSVPRDSSGNFARFYPGDRLRLPQTWNAYVYADGSGVSGGAPLPVAQPVPGIPPKPSPSGPPDYSSTLADGSIAYVKGQLGKWGALTGKIDPAGYPGPLDVNPTQPDAMDPRFYQAVASFQRWYNAQPGIAQLRSDGRLDKPTHDAINAYDASTRGVLPQPGTPLPQLPQPGTPLPQLPQPGTPLPQLPQPGAPLPQLPPAIPPFIAGPTAPTGAPPTIPTFPGAPGTGPLTQAQKDSGGGLAPLAVALAAIYAFA